eukprot:3297484-Prorocentrum_lima.AAC.1
MDAKWVGGARWMEGEARGMEATWGWRCGGFEVRWMEGETRGMEAHMGWRCKMDGMRNKRDGGNM